MGNGDAKGNSKWMVIALASGLGVPGIAGASKNMQHFTPKSNVVHHAGSGQSPLSILTRHARENYRKILRSDNVLEESVSVTMVGELGSEGNTQVYKFEVSGREAGADHRIQRTGRLNLTSSESGEVPGRELLPNQYLFSIVNMDETGFPLPTKDLDGVERFVKRKGPLRTRLGDRTNATGMPKTAYGDDFDHMVKTFTADISFD